MTQRPSLLDDGDLGAIGTGGAGRRPTRRDSAGRFKLLALVGTIGLAALVWLRPWHWAGGDARPMQSVVETEAQREEFRRQQQQIQLGLEQGVISTNGA
jgi:hypothetical protein